MRRTIILLLIGLFIIGVSLGLRAIEIPCDQCGRDGKIECLDCLGVGASVVGAFWVECGCRSKNYECLACRGMGGYIRSVIGPCETCEAKGGKICHLCNGTGGIRFNQRVLQIFGLK